MLVTLDFETYWDADYTLKKMATSEYIRDPRFEALSCSIKIADRKAFCFFGHDKIKRGLARIDWSKATVLAHHTHFDGLILSHHFGVIPARYACSLSMARALHPKSERNDLGSVADRYGKTNKLPMPDFKGKRLSALTKQERHAITAYNNADVESCRQVYDEMVKKMPVEELDLIDITVRMFAAPVLEVDMILAKRELDEERERRETAITASGATKDELSSNPKFVKRLEALGIDVPMKPSPSVPGKKIPAIAKSDDSLQDLRNHPDEAVSLLVEGRLAAKSALSETRAARMLLRGEGGMKLPLYIGYALAHTLRWAGGDKFNPQNFKHAHKSGGGLKKAMMAPKGEVIVKVDASQIEARLVAWLAEEDWILDAFRLGRDLYCEFSSDAYERPITKADTEERFVGKTCVLGLGFGMGGPKLQYSILTKSIEQGLTPVRLPLEVCFHLVTTYRMRCQRIVALWKLFNDRAIAAMLSGVDLDHKCLRFDKGKMHLPNGLALLYPGLSANVVRHGSKFFKGTAQESVQDASYLNAHSRNKIYGGLLVENAVQALARIVVADKMRVIAARRRVVLMEHDAVAWLAPSPEGQADLDWAIDLFREPPSWAPDLPLNAEGKFDERFP